MENNGRKRILRMEEWLFYIKKFDLLNLKTKYSTSGIYLCMMARKLNSY